MVSNRKRGRPGGDYIERGDDSEQLTLMDQRYFEEDDGKPVIFRSIGKNKRTIYWGTRLPRAQGGFELGVRGKVWALFLLLSMQSTVPTSLSELARAIEKSTPADLKPKIVGAANRERSARPRAGEKTVRLRDLIFQLASENQKEACPPAHVSQDLLEAVLKYCETTCFQGTARKSGHEEAVTQFRSAAVGTSSSPSDLYIKLRSIVPTISPKLPGVRPVGRSAKTSWPRDEEAFARLSEIEPSLDHELSVTPTVGRTERYHRAEQADYDDDVVSGVLRALESSERRKARLIVLSGRPFAGKKAKVLSLLRVIATREKDRLLIRLRTTMGDPLALLPIRAWSARGVHYRELVSNVVKFLEHYDRRINGGADSATVVTPETSLEQLFEHIRKFHKNCPALFVFTDVDAFRADHDRNVIRDIGIKNLIRALLESNGHSLMMLTTSESLKASAASVGLPLSLEVPVEVHIPDLKRFLSPGIMKTVSQALSQQNFSELRGDDLLAIAALINLSGGLVAPVLEACKAFLQKNTDDRRKERVGIYRLLLEAAEARKMLHVLALIAASDDGLRDDSLARLLTIWAEHDQTVPAFADLEAVQTAVEAFSELAGAKFLIRTRMARYDPDEYGFDEHHAGSDNIWEIDCLISAMLVESLHALRPELAQHAHRLVALLARQRAQNKKVMMRSPLGSRAAEDASRDIQCYVSLLASIQLPEIPEPAGEDGVLRLSEREVFSLDPNGFRARRALRFAVQCLLREDIDHDHRLTMVFDEDALRLDLYLLLFHELGRRHHTLLEPLKIPDRLPRHLAPEFLSEEQVMGLMTTVALSALYAQRFDVVHGVASLAEAYVREQSVAGRTAEIVRIWCSQIDAYLLQGGISKTNPRHRETLDFVRQVRRTHFGKVPNSDAFSKDTPLSGEQLEAIKADMRLLAREAEVCALTDQDPAIAQGLYDELERREALLSERFAQHDPIVLSGRVARGYLRFLLRNGDSRDEALISRANALLGANISRLRRFSGADRFGVMLDLARLHQLRDNLRVARDWAHAAYVRAQSGHASYGSKLDVFAVYADLNIRLAECDLTQTDHFETGHRVATDMYEVAVSLEYRPFRALAEYLLARCLLLQYRREKPDSRGKRISKTVQEAHKRIDSARQTMLAIGDISFDDDIAKINERIVEEWDAQT